MTEHKKYLDKFVRVFRSVDKLRTGVINEEQFKELIYKMEIFEGDQDSEIKRLLVELDPHKVQFFTFS